MSKTTPVLSRITHVIHSHLLGLVIGAYILAAFLPGPGLWLRNATIIKFGVDAAGSAVKALPLLLGLLLFSAGLRVRIEQAGRILRQPRMVLIGVVANLAVPVAYIVMIALGLRHWNDMEEAESLLVGLALVAAMPIAGSSAGWAQHNDADLSLSLGLVLLSTLLSPLTTPLTLRSVGLVALGQPAVQLQHLASHGTGVFLALWVLMPTVLGILSRILLGEKRVERCADAVKMGSTLCLFILCYANAAVCLPMLLHEPDWDFLGLSLLIVTGLCVLTFATGSVIGRLAQTGRPQRVSLMFGLGMNNNGTGLVLASMALGSTPIMMLPIILYNLIQHLAAGCVSSLAARRFLKDRTPAGLSPAFARRPGAVRPCLRRERSV
jgi:bile acid:Na+ symporter, BASS family